MSYVNSGTYISPHMVILIVLGPICRQIVLSLLDHEGKPQDGFLRSHDVFNLKLPAELIVLSACETGLGKDVRGEGLVPLCHSVTLCLEPLNKAVKGHSTANGIRP